MEETKKKIEELSFEEAMAELGALVQASESGKLPLEEMLSSLERGHALAVYCRGKLNELERRIRQAVEHVENRAAGIAENDFRAGLGNGIHERLGAANWRIQSFHAAYYTTSGDDL